MLGALSDAFRLGAHRAPSSSVDVGALPGSLEFPLGPPERLGPVVSILHRDGERIYHTPWGSQWHRRTKISVDRGERWFCSEREALDAGWRAPLR